MRILALCLLLTGCTMQPVELQNYGDKQYQAYKAFEYACPTINKIQNKAGLNQHLSCYSI